MAAKLLYSLLMYLLRPLLLLVFLWRSRADAGYRQRLHERFGWQSIPVQARSGLLLHAVSMGEVIAAAPLIRQLLQQYPQLPLTVTTTTPTGSAQLRRLFGDQVWHWYLPLDTPGACRRFLRKLAPQLLIVLETELWPNLLSEANRQGVTTMLVNARLSARSARGYCKVLCLLRPLLQQFATILTVDTASQRRFRLLAGKPEQAGRIVRSGNLKFDFAVADDLTERAGQLKNHWGDRLVWVAGSTHAGEDEQVLLAHQQLLQQWPNLLLILVPRHPDRFEQVAALLDSRGLSYRRRSQHNSASANLHAGTQVLLGDTMGELMLWYQLADVVFIGGSLIERGGHNPLEAMCLAKPVLAGRHLFNFREIYQQLASVGGLWQVDDADSLRQAVGQLLHNPAQARIQAQAGLQLFRRHGGALALTTHAIASLPLAVPRTSTTAAVIDWLSPADASVIPACWAEPGWWQQQHAVCGYSTGRNKVYFVKAPVAGADHIAQQQTRQWVLRHYYRGGLIGRLNRDWFWPVPLAQSRAMAEFRLLLWMRQQGLPVPAPVAARYVSRGWGYSADILLERVPDSEDLSRVLLRTALPAQQWQQLGQQIARLQHAGVYHSDLNCHNILLSPAQGFVLIDFDKCCRRPGIGWHDEPLARLKRSFQKEQKLAAQRQQPFHFTLQAWQQLESGYQQAMLQLISAGRNNAYC